MSHVRLLRVLPKLWRFNTAFQETASRGHGSFTTAFKLKVIQLVEEKGKHHACQVFKVDRKRVREWCQKKALITDLAKSARRVYGAGPKPRFQVKYCRLQLNRD